MAKYIKLTTCLALVAGAAIAGSDYTALEGDGSNGGLEIAPSGFKMTSSTYTVEAWVWTGTIQSEGPIMDQFVGNGTQGDWSFVVYSQQGKRGNLAIMSRGVTTDKGSNWLLSDSALPVLTWTHVAVAVDGTTVKFYINGTLDTVHTISSGSTLPVQSGVFRIGTENRNGKPCFKGKLSDCRVWNVARTAEEIAGNRFVRLTGTEQGLAAYWPLDEGSGSSVANKVAGTTDAISGSTYGWADVRTPLVACNVSARHVVANSSGSWSAGRITTDGFKITGSAFSLEGWIRPKSLANFNVLFEQFSSSQAMGDIRFQIRANTWDDGRCIPAFLYRGFGDGNWLYGTSEIPLYKWTHLAVTCDGDLLSLYVDGVQEATLSRTAQNRITPQQITPLVLLGYTKDSDVNYNQCDGKAANGWASDMRVWNRSLSAEEVASNRFSRLTGHELGLVGYWPLAETEGTVATNYASAALTLNDGTLSGNFAFEECGSTPFVANSTAIDDSCVLANGRFDTQTRIWQPSYTLEAWVKLMGHGNNVIFSQFSQSDTDNPNNGRNGDLRMTVDRSGKLAGFLREFVSGNWVYSTATIPLREWVHLAVSYDGAKMKLYINGQKDSEFSGSRISPNSAGLLYVGGTANDSTLGFNGRLSDLRVWDTARTDAEIAASYTSRLTGREPHLQGYWPLGQASGNTVFNYSRQGVADGVAVGTLTWYSNTSTPFHVKGMQIIFR